LAKIRTGGSQILDIEHYYVLSLVPFVPLLHFIEMAVEPIPSSSTHSVISKVFLSLGSFSAFTFCIFSSHVLNMFLFITSRVYCVKLRQTKLEIRFSLRPLKFERRVLSVSFRCT
jgi:hypothetical protein